MATTYNIIIDELFDGAKTRQQLIDAGAGVGVSTRIHEINRTFKDIQIITLKRGLYKAHRVADIKIDKARVYPNQRKSKALK